MRHKVFMMEKCVFFEIKNIKCFCFFFKGVLGRKKLRSRRYSILLIYCLYPFRPEEIKHTSDILISKEKNEHIKQCHS